MRGSSIGRIRLSICPRYCLNLILTIRGELLRYINKPLLLIAKSKHHINSLDGGRGIAIVLCSYPITGFLTSKGRFQSLRKRMSSGSRWLHATLNH
jgi:hypothetical protein